MAELHTEGAQTGERVHDSPVDRIQKHINENVETGGETGHEWRPCVPTLLLTTRGRQSGKLRRTALIYGRDGDDYLIVASYGGHDHHPAWYLNLDADPQVEVQVMDDRFSATARTVDAAEKPRLWAIMIGIWPDYVTYQAKTRRDIPIVVLARQSE